MEWTSNGPESNLEGGLVRGGRSAEAAVEFLVLMVFRLARG